MLGLRYPLFQAPTGSVAGPELAAAVSAAGAMGAMGLTWTTTTDAVDHVRLARRATSAPFLINFALAFRPVALEACLDAGAPVVSFSFGDPKNLIGPVRERNAILGIQVTSAEGAKYALDLGADFLVCQGTEAGGHVQAMDRLEDNLASVVQETREIPVVASGGIANGAGIARVLGLGAKGAMLGTRFVATKESRAHPDYKELILRSTGDETALTMCFEGGWPQAAHRVLRNSTLRNWEAHGSPNVGNRPGEGDVIAHSAGGEAIFRYEDAAPRMGMTGDIEAMCLYAGAGCGEIRDIPSAAELVERLAREAGL